MAAVSKSSQLSGSAQRLQDGAPCVPFTTLSNAEMIHSEAPEIRAIRRTRRLSQPAEIGEALGNIVDRVFETCEDLIC